MAEIRCLLKEAGVMSGKEPALIQGEYVLLFSQLDVQADDTAGRLLERGLQPGDRVAFSLPADWRVPVLLMGLLRAGAVACPMNTRLPPGPLAAQARTVGARYLVGDFKGGDGKEWEGLTCLDISTLVGAGPPAGRMKIRDHMPLDDPATIVFTSGSRTARAAVLSYGNHYYAARASNQHLPLHSPDRWMLNLPLYHVAGLGILFRCLRAGAAMVFPEPDCTVPEVILSRGVTHLSLVPAQLAELLDMEKGPAALAGLKVLLLGGSGIPAPLYEKAVQAGCPVCCTYGMTETASQITTVGLQVPAVSRATAGTPLPGMEVALDEQGEIRVRGRSVFLGYVEGSAIEPAVDAQGWLTTGDLGSFDAGGYLSVLGRRDNIFVSGGENVQPEAVEAEVLRLPGVEQVIVVPVPHPKFGARPVAFVRTRPGMDAPVDFATLLAGRLPKYMIPDRWLPWPEDLPADAKPSRTLLAERAAG